MAKKGAINDTDKMIKQADETCEKIDMLLIKSQSGQHSSETKRQHEKDIRREFRKIQKIRTNLSNYNDKDGSAISDIKKKIDHIIDRVHQVLEERKQKTSVSSQLSQSEREYFLDWIRNFQNDLINRIKELRNENHPKKKSKQHKASDKNEKAIEILNHHATKIESIIRRFEQDSVANSFTGDQVKELKKLMETLLQNYEDQQHNAELDALYETIESANVSLEHSNSSFRLDEDEKLKNDDTTQDEKMRINRIKPKLYKP